MSIPLRLSSARGLTANPHQATYYLKMTQVQPSLEFIPPAYNPLVWNIARGIMPFWLRYNYDITKDRD